MRYERQFRRVKGVTGVLQWVVGGCLFAGLDHDVRYLGIVLATLGCMNLWDAIKGET